MMRSQYNDNLRESFKVLNKQKILFQYVNANKLGWHWNSTILITHGYSDMYDRHYSWKYDEIKMWPYVNQKS